ncbi:MAG TPA: hypothetical protein VK436_12455 [Methanocella sp.]|nr:hypothetical protein [Methanocella sp.]
MSLLKDRTFIVLVSILFVIGILFVIVLYTLSDNVTTGSNGRFKVGENLSEQQKSLVLDIVMNDAILKNELDDTEAILTRENTGVPEGNFYIDDISVAKYNDSDLNISGVWPAVTFIVGNISHEGPTLQAFIDPDIKQVVYIQKTWRSVNGNLNNIHLANVSITDTGYKMNSNLTDEEQTSAIKIVLVNESVREYLEGNNYTLNSVTIGESRSSKGYSFTYNVYPSVTLYVSPNTMIDASVDIKNNKVVLLTFLPYEGN